MKAIVTIMPKQTVLDPQGAAIAQAMKHCGFEGVGKVWVGKRIEIELLNPKIDESSLQEICRDLLSNPVIESYTLTIQN